MGRVYGYWGLVARKVPPKGAHRTCAEQGFPQKDQEQGLVKAVDRGARLTKAPYDMPVGRISCTVVGRWLGILAGKAFFLVGSKMDQNRIKSLRLLNCEVHGSGSNVATG